MKPDEMGLGEEAADPGRKCQGKMCLSPLARSAHEHMPGFGRSSSFQLLHLRAGQTVNC